jgi:hypothetical protein
MVISLLLDDGPHLSIDSRFIPGKDHRHASASYPPLITKPRVPGFSGGQLVSALFRLAAIMNCPNFRQGHLRPHVIFAFHFLLIS